MQYYVVLIPVSQGYPSVKGRQCTRYSPVRRSPSEPKSYAAPRLACIKPPASVHPEPGSNSPLYNFLQKSYRKVCLCYFLALNYFLTFTCLHLIKDTRLLRYYLNLNLKNLVLNKLQSTSCKLLLLPNSFNELFAYLVANLSHTINLYEQRFAADLSL